MTQPDALIDSYRAAQKLQKDTEPSALTRRRILAHAQQLVNNNHRSDAVIFSENDTNLIAKNTINTPAANDSQWRMRALASVAVFGIAGLLMLQLSKEAPNEFSPKTKSPVSSERAAGSTAISESDSTTKAKNSSQTPLQAPASTSDAVNKSAESLAPSPAPAQATKPAPLREQRVNKNDSVSRDDVEAAVKKESKSAKESKTEVMTDKAAEVTPSFAPLPLPLPPSAAAAPAAVIAPAPAPAPAPANPASASAGASVEVAESTKFSRSSTIAPRANTKAANTTTNANIKLFSAIQTKDATALKLALDGGDDKNAKTNDGTPALSLCVQSDQLTLVQLLLAAGADVDALDALGVSPLTHARNRGLTDIVNLLLNFGAK
jgi:hypothetical protein